MLKIIVTGGLGFIGSNFIRQRLETHPQDKVINVDKITYASNPLNLDLARNARYSFARCDISNYESMRPLVTIILNLNHLKDHPDPQI